MLPWLLIVVVLGVLVVWRCGVRFGQLGRKKRMLSPTDRILVITAHPDDECMFFGPFILAAVRKWRSDVFLLCCSTGNHDGKGEIRQKELRNACEILGVPAHNIRCLDDRDLPDNPTCKWSSTKLTEIILKQIHEWNPTVIVTFDANGVSGHKNHCDLSEAVVSMQKGELIPHGVRILLLESVHFIRKYSKYLDVMMTIHTEFDLITLVRREDEAVISKAMLAHKSQMVWFRWLYITFSRYMLLNTFKEFSGKPTSQLWISQENRTFRALGGRCASSAESGWLNAVAAETSAWRQVLICMQVFSDRAREALLWTTVALGVDYKNIILFIEAHQDISEFLMTAIKDEATAIFEQNDELFKVCDETRTKQILNSQLHTVQILHQDNVILIKNLK